MLIEKHEGVRALARTCIERWNRGRWVRSTVDVDASPTNGEGMITVVTDGTRQGVRYHLPEDPDDLRQAIFALCEDPKRWKSQHTRDFGKE